MRNSIVQTDAVRIVRCERNPLLNQNIRQHRKSMSPSFVIGMPLVRPGGDVGRTRIHGQADYWASEVVSVTALYGVPTPDIGTRRASIVLIVPIIERDLNLTSCA